MFDNIVVFRNNQTGTLIDKGMLAEALLFYDNVHLLLNRGTLSALWNQLGAEGVDRLIDRPEVRISYLRQNFGTIGTGPSALRSYSYSVFQSSGTTKRAKLSSQEELEQVLERSLGRSKITRKRITRLMSVTSFPRIEDDITPSQLTQGASGDLDDKAFVEAAIGSAINLLAPTYHLQQGWHFRILKFADGSFTVDTNLNFAAINAEYHKTVAPQHSSISPTIY